jgi:zinc transport system substrate-binding protein
MTPTVQAQAVGNITAFLAGIDPENASYYQGNAEAELAAITAKGNDLKVKLAAGNLSQINVLCDTQITGLVQWAGFNVIASYPRPEDISAKQMQELIDQGKQGGVVIVIANLQSGTPDAAVTMADGIGAVQATISNFPGGLDDTETWEKALEKDVDLMLEAAATYRGNSH